MEEKKEEPEIVKRLNKVLKCKHLFSSEQGDAPTMLILHCQECNIKAEVEIIAYK